MTNDPSTLRKIAEAATQTAWRDLLEKDDRTSDSPEMCLITFEELRGYIEDAARSLLDQQEQNAATIERMRAALDEGVLAEALERSLRDAGISKLLHSSMVNVIGRHVAHHVFDVAEDFRARETLASIPQEPKG